MSTLRVNTLQDATGSNQPAMVGAAKAWVNFNGTGTVAIRAAFNVSSITDNGTGNYTVNFTNAMTDANYSFALSGQRADFDNGDMLVAVAGNQSADITTSYINLQSQHGSSSTVSDALSLAVIIFR